MQGTKSRNHLGNATRERLPHVRMAIDQPWDNNMVWQADNIVCTSEIRRSIFCTANPSHDVSFNKD